MNIQRCVLSFSGLCCGAYCAYAAFRFNVALARGEDGFVFASVMAALTVGCWALLPIAAEKWRERAKLSAAAWVIGWGILMTLVIANSAGFTAGGRREAVTEKAVAIEAYERAQHARKEASDGLAVAIAGKRWKEVDRFRASIETAEAALAKGRPGASDPQAELLSMMTGASPETVGRVLPIATTLVLEFAANLLLLAAATTRRRPSKTVERKEIERPRLVADNVDVAAMNRIKKRIAALN
jgi:hypothetical protein